MFAINKICVYCGCSCFYFSTLLVEAKMIHVLAYQSIDKFGILYERWIAWEGASEERNPMWLV